MFMADPIAAGLSSCESGEFGGYTANYRKCAHVMYPFHVERPAAERRTTLVLPTFQQPDLVVHEFGHVLHEALEFEPFVCVAVTDYAAATRWEAFAEAFTAWVLARNPEHRQPAWGWEDPQGWKLAADLLQDRDPATWALFERLAIEGA